MKPFWHFVRVQWSLPAGTGTSTTALDFIIENFSSDREVCDLALSLEILMASLWVTFLNVRIHLFIWGNQVSEVLKPRAKQTEALRYPEYPKELCAHCFISYFFFYIYCLGVL